MNRHDVRGLLPGVLLLALAIGGCCKDDGAAGGKGSPSGSAAASAAPLSGGATAGKRFHVKRVQDECTFDFDAPEELKETTKDGMSFTLESESFSFVGFAGTTLHSEPEHPLDSMKDKFKTVYRGKESGIPLAIVKDVAPPKDPKDKHYVTGAGGEPYSDKRNLGCTFLCDGVAAREADVVALCKSVKVTVAPDKEK